MMGVSQLWAAYRAGAAHDDVAAMATTAQERFYTGLVAQAQDARAAAVEHITAASRQEPARVVFAECAHYLAGLGSAGAADTAEVYISPEAFSAFGRGGGNVELYRRTHEALTARYRELRPAALLDIGTGEGLGLLPSLTGDVGRVDVVEPSGPRLAVTAKALAERDIEHRTFEETMATFMAQVGAGERWDLAQETFAMLSLPSAERPATLRWLRERASRLVLVEFDVPRAEHALHPDWFDYVVTRYEAGMAEYPEPHNLVRQGFLAPVLLGTLRPDEDKVHHEQTAADWCRDLIEAGFTPEGEPRKVADFWWGEAYLIEGC
ncbi:class I SAM-dependent methyltransferase [Amycolatopsis cihanbeyliensis]|uniref:Methyltransferase family protein n=1 Tax=Amycolatopsis cihanbeyliensis TaxID=1128664 RepID=A0A542DIT7_AMYCI|nr:class I SAM-dependent methyltransferase [Amycolatopsis cihanbeyliensis]TQJ03021.1 hypothetical protein FB471_2771 [Amycolatopsis cihanbeyliensis]